MDHSEIVRLQASTAAIDTALDGYPVVGLMESVAVLSSHGRSVARHVVGAWIAELEVQIRALPAADTDALRLARDRVVGAHAALAALLPTL